MKSNKNLTPKIKVTESGWKGFDWLNVDTFCRSDVLELKLVESTAHHSGIRWRETKYATIIEEENNNNIASGVHHTLTFTYETIMIMKNKITK